MVTKLWENMEKTAKDRMGVTDDGEGNEVGLTYYGIIHGLTMAADACFATTDINVRPRWYRRLAEECQKLAQRKRCLKKRLFRRTHRVDPDSHQSGKVMLAVNKGQREMCTLQEQLRQVEKKLRRTSRAIKRSERRMLWKMSDWQRLSQRVGKARKVPPLMLVSAATGSRRGDNDRKTSGAATNPAASGGLSAVDNGALPLEDQPRNSGSRTCCQTREENDSLWAHRFELLVVDQDDSDSRHASVRQMILGEPQPAMPAWVILAEKLRPLNAHEAESEKSDLRKCGACGGCQHTRPITDGELVGILRALKNGKGEGIDGIKSELIKGLTVKNRETFRRFLNNWLMGRIELPPTAFDVILQPLYKGKGSELDVSSYRPIRLQSAIVKICEKVLLQRMEECKRITYRLFPEQIGFRRGVGAEQGVAALMMLLRQRKDGLLMKACSTHEDFIQYTDTL